MRNILLFLLGVQITLCGAGIWQITEGKYSAGLFNIILNGLFGYINYCNIKNFKK